MGPASDPAAPSRPTRRNTTTSPTSDEAPATIADAYKAAFRGHPAGVAVITAEGPDGPTGLTASSVASVAIDPPVLVFSLSTNSGSAGVVLGAPLFVVHLVDSLGVDLAKRFAATGSPAADDPIWSRLPSGEHYLPGAATALRCRPLSTTPIGSSTVVVAEVLDIVLGLERGEPLVYHNREFHSLTDRSRLSTSRGAPPANH